MNNEQQPVSWASYVHAYGEWTTNLCRFATKDEAERAGAELLSRWWVPDAHEARPSNEPVNWEFPEDADRPRPIQHATPNPA